MILTIKDNKLSLIADNTGKLPITSDGKFILPYHLGLVGNLQYKDTDTSETNYVTRNGTPIMYSTDIQVKLDDNSIRDYGDAYWYKENNNIYMSKGEYNHIDTPKQYIWNQMQWMPIVHGYYGGPAGADPYAFRNWLVTIASGSYYEPKMERDLIRDHGMQQRLQAEAQTELLTINNLLNTFEGFHY